MNDMKIVLNEIIGKHGGKDFEKSVTKPLTKKQIIDKVSTRLNMPKKYIEKKYKSLIDQKYEDNMNDYCVYVISKMVFSEVAFESVLPRHILESWKLDKGHRVSDTNVLIHFGYEGKPLSLVHQYLHRFNNAKVIHNDLDGNTKEFNLIIKKCPKVKSNHALVVDTNGNIIDEYHKHRSGLDAEKRKKWNVEQPSLALPLLR